MGRPIPIRDLLVLCAMYWILGLMLGYGLANILHPDCGHTVDAPASGGDR